MATPSSSSAGLFSLTGTQVEGTGHIFVVRRQESFPSDEGPQVVTAGMRNFKSASMKFAFGDEPLAWPDAIQLLCTTLLLNKGIVWSWKEPPPGACPVQQLGPRVVGVRGQRP